MQFPIQQPTLLLDESICRANILRMAEKARRLHLVLRPHLKTPQAHLVADWLREEGIETATVSSLRMAAYFARAGWKDLTVAFPVNILEIAAIKRLAAQIQLNLLLVAQETVPFLGKQMKHPVGVFLKIDSGAGRAGFQPDDFSEIDRMLESISKYNHLIFKGFLTHAGQTYQARSRAEILERHAAAMERIRRLRAHYAHAFPQMTVSVGDTPSCSVAEDFEGADEIRPGNFMYYDWMQLQIGSCTPEDIAVCVACPVVARYPERNECVVYGGAVHLSKDYLHRPDGSLYFGIPVRLHERGWSFFKGDNFVRALSQEHGVLRLSPEAMEELRVGSLVGIVPIHSCLTADMLKKGRLTDGRMFRMMR